MEIKIEIEELKKRKLFVAAPMYGGQCHGMFCRSTNDLASLCMHYGIELKFYYLFNESLITRARNYCCDEFMRDESSTHMIFIDSDIGFDARDVLSMLALQDAEEGMMNMMCCVHHIQRSVFLGRRLLTLLTKVEQMKIQTNLISL